MQRSEGYERLGPATFEISLVKPAKFASRIEVDSIDGLKKSIREVGLLQPIVVRRISERSVEIVEGHRRFKAICELGFTRVPCYVKELSERDAFEVYLGENMQRRNFDPLEEAKAFKHYLTRYGYGSISHLASLIGRSEEYVSHKILLLSLPIEVLQKVESGEITASHAQELLWLKDKNEQVRLAEEAAKKRLTVRELRKAVKMIQSGNKSSVTFDTADGSSFSYYAEERKEHWIFILRKSLLGLRRSMGVLDAIIANVPNDDWELHEFLTAKRIEIHGIIDEHIRFRIKREKFHSVSRP